MTLTRMEIKDKYLRLHDDLSAKFYALKRPTASQKAKFDLAHGRIWRDHEDELRRKGLLTALEE